MRRHVHSQTAKRNQVPKATQHMVPAIEARLGTGIHVLIIRGWLDVGIHRTPGEDELVCEGISTSVDHV